VRPLQRLLALPDQDLVDDVVDQLHHAASNPLPVHLHDHLARSTG
jgi:hypothetical protein